MSASNYQGVILAAGHGSRMGPFGDELPKPIAPICNKPLLAYQIEAMRAVGIEDVTVVIGHLGHRIIHAIGDGEAYGVRIRYVEQEKRLGLAHAVGQLENHVNRPFLLMLGDIFFRVINLDEMFAIARRSNAAAVLAVKEEPDEAAIRRNFAVLLNTDGSVRRVIEKPRHAPNNLKGCGLYLFDDRIFEAVRRTPRTAMRDEYELTDSIQILIDYEYPVRTANIVEWDINLTFIGDLIRCCVHELRRFGKASLVGKGCTISNEIDLVETVVGDGAVVEGHGRIERCVVLAGARLDADSNYADAIITRNGVLQAN